MIVSGILVSKYKIDADNLLGRHSLPVSKNPLSFDFNASFLKCAIIHPDVSIYDNASLHHFNSVDKRFVDVCISYDRILVNFPLRTLLFSYVRFF